VVIINFVCRCRLVRHSGYFRINGVVKESRRQMSVCLLGDKMRERRLFMAGVATILTLSISNSARAGSPSECNAALVFSTYNKIDASKSDRRMAMFADQEPHSKIAQSPGLSAVIYGVSVGGSWNQFQEKISHYRISTNNSISQEQFKNVALTWLSTNAADAYKEYIRSKRRGLHIILDKSSDTELSLRIYYSVVGGSPNPLPVVWSGGAAKGAVFPRHVNAGESICICSSPQVEGP
jgi:hypothetical protein